MFSLQEILLAIIWDIWCPNHPLYGHKIVMYVHNMGTFLGLLTIAKRSKLNFNVCEIKLPWVMLLLISWDFLLYVNLWLHVRTPRLAIYYRCVIARCPWCLLGKQKPSQSILNLDLKPVHNLTYCSVALETHKNTFTNKRSICWSHCVASVCKRPFLQYAPIFHKKNCTELP